ncbi:MAG: phosphodiester glycosidase family protein [Pseudomonadota bacterium]
MAARLSTVHVALVVDLLVAPACHRSPTCANPDLPTPGTWATWAPGLELGRFAAPGGSIEGDSIITVLRVEPALWPIELHAQVLGGAEAPLTAREWGERLDLVATTNAGMYTADGLHHVGAMWVDGQAVGQANEKYDSVAVSGPRRAELAPFALLDRDDPSFPGLEALAKDYRYLVQNLRLIKRPGENRWEQQPRIWSEAALAEDDQGRALLIFVGSPYSMHDLNRALLGLDLGIVAAQHLDGGPPAQLWARAGEHCFHGIGGYETGVRRWPWQRSEWPLPLVWGVRAPE